MVKSVYMRAARIHTQTRTPYKRGLTSPSSHQRSARRVRRSSGRWSLDSTTSRTHGVPVVPYVDVAIVDEVDKAFAVGAHNPCVQHTLLARRSAPARCAAQLPEGVTLPLVVVSCRCTLAAPATSALVSICHLLAYPP